MNTCKVFHNMVFHFPELIHCDPEHRDGNSPPLPASAGQSKPRVSKPTGYGEIEARSLDFNPSERGKKEENSPDSSTLRIHDLEPTSTETTTTTGMIVLKVQAFLKKSQKHRCVCN